MPDIFDEISEAPAPDIFDQLAAQPAPEDPGRVTKQPQTLGEWGRFMAGGLLHPIRAAETGIEQFAIQHGLAEPGSRLLPGLSLGRALETPIVGTIPKIKQQKSVPAQLGAAAVNTVTDFVNFFGTPEGLGTLGLGALPKAASRAILADYATEMAMHTPEQIQGAIEEAKKGNWQGAAQNALGAAGASVMVPFIAKHAGAPAASHPSVTLPKSLEALKEGEPKAPTEPSPPAEPMEPKTYALGKPVEVLETNAKKGTALVKMPDGTTERVKAGDIETRNVPVKTPEAVEMERVRQLPEGPEGEQQLVAEDISKAVETVDVGDIATYSPVPALVRIIRKAPQDPAMKTAAEQAMQKIGQAAKEQGVGLDTIKSQLGEELKAVYGENAPEMADYYFGRPSAPESVPTRPGPVLEGGEPSQQVSPPTGPSPQALGIAPPGSGLMGQVIAAIRPKTQGKLPEAPSTAGEWLPDLGERATNKEIAVDPTGIGRIPVLNWLFDPRHRVKTEPEKAIMGWVYEQGVGKSHVKALGSTFGTRFKELFPRSESGEFTTVERTRQGQSLHPSDVFEGLQRDPQSYRLAPEQRAAFDELMGYEKRARELAQKYGLRQNAETGEYEPGKSGAEAYYTRGRAVGEPKRKGAGGGALGGRQYFQKERAFSSEQEGAKNGFRYPLNVDERILFRLDRLYKAIADKRLAEDEGLGGRWGGSPTYGEQSVFQPAFRRSYAVEGKAGEPIPITEHKIFPAEVAEKVNAKFADQTPWLKATATVNDYIKGWSLGIDFGVGQIQGLVTLFRNPVAWRRAQANMLKAFASPDGFAAYIRDNPANVQAVRELAQYGSGVGGFSEMIKGLEGGGVEGLVGKRLEAGGYPIPGKVLSAIGGAKERFGRSFQTFLDVAKIERWKAQREVTPREEWPRAIQTIEHELQSGRMEAIGLHPAQALAERVFLLAPSYYRGAIALIGDMTQKGVSGKQARQAMGSYITGTIATFGALAVAAGLSWDEIKRRLDPSKGNFLMVPVKIGGKAIEVGFGGIIRSLVRLGGQLLEAGVKNPENLKSLQSDKNPVLKWLRGHGSPVVGTAWNLLSGADYSGKDVDLTTQSRTLLPIWAQDLWRQQKGQTGAMTAANMAAQFLGLNAYPQSVRNAMMVERDKLAKTKFAKSYENLKFGQQLAVSRAIQKQPEFAVKEPANPQQIARAFRNQVERQSRVQESLAKPILSVLEENGLHVTGFEPTLTIGKTKVFLTDDQQKRYESLIVEEYNRALKPRVGALNRMPPARGQDALNGWLGTAKQRAQARLRLEFNKPTP